MFDRVWEEIHAKREWGRYPKEELVRWVIRTYGDRSSEERASIRCLDVGCGAGASSWFLAREGFGVVAIDGSLSAIKRLNSLPERLVGDCVHLPFKDDSFDAVIDIVCVAHNELRDARRIVTEMARVLRPGGRVFSAIPAREGTHDAYQNKGAVTLFDRYEVTDLYSREFTDISVDWTLTCEGDNYTKLWFVKAILKENT